MDESSTERRIAVEVKFERIGRNRTAAPLCATVDFSQPDAADDLAAKINQHRRKAGGIGSRDVSIDLCIFLPDELEGAAEGAEIGEGGFSCGGRDGGRFTIRRAVSA